MALLMRSYSPGVIEGVKREKACECIIQAHATSLLQLFFLGWPEFMGEPVAALGLHAPQSPVRSTGIE